MQGKHVNKQGVMLVLDEPTIPLTEEELDHVVKTGTARTQSGNIPLIYKVCAMCDQPFSTTRSNKNICSLPCKIEHNRRHARYYARMRRNGPKKYEPCIVCGFSETTDKHHEGKKEYILCPNHHCLITRNLKTLDELLSERR